MLFSPTDFQAVTKILDSLNDGEDMSMVEGEEKKVVSVSDEEAAGHGGKEGGSSEDSGPGGPTEAASEEEVEEGRVGSAVHVCANVGLVHLVFHSDDCGEIMALSVEGE